MLQLVREGIAINPHYRKVTPVVADELARWGDWRNAVWIWDSVLASRPNVVVLLTNAARGYDSLGQRDRALAYLERARRIQPQAPAVRVAGGACCSPASARSTSPCARAGGAGRGRRRLRPAQRRLRAGHARARYGRWRSSCWSCACANGRRAGRAGWCSSGCYRTRAPTTGRGRWPRSVWAWPVAPAAGTRALWQHVPAAYRAQLVAASAPQTSASSR